MLGTSDPESILSRQVETAGDCIVAWGHAKGYTAINYRIAPSQLCQR
jgi:hypothetical protein